MNKNGMLKWIPIMREIAEHVYTEQGREKPGDNDKIISETVVIMQRYQDNGDEHDAFGMWLAALYTVATYAGRPMNIKEICEAAEPYMVIERAHVGKLSAHARELYGTDCRTFTEERAPSRYMINGGKG